MDSSNPACAKRKDQEAMTVTCKRTKFMATYYRQNFSMPDSVIFYVAKNPKTAELYLKMVKTCKYFFVKQPIIIVPNLRDGNGKWRCGEVPLNLTKYNCKYWITGEIYASASEFVDKNIFSPIIPKLYRCDVKCLYLFDQVISYHDLSLLITSAKRIRFDNVVVKHADSSDVPLEDIVTVAVNAKSVYVDKPTITPKTMKKLTKLSHFLKLDGFHLSDLTEVFDIDEFYGYMKKNLRTKFCIGFDPQISDAFKNRVEAIVDEILETGQFNYKPPLIDFTGLDMFKRAKLYEIYCSH